MLKKDNNSKKLSLIWISLIVGLSYLFYILFFALKTNHNQFFITASQSIISLIIVFFSPYLLFIPIIYRKKNDNTKIILKNVTDIEAFALISLLSFLYTILSTLIFQYLIGWNFLITVLVFCIFPFIICVFKFKTIYLTLKKWLINSFKSNFILYIGLVFLISLYIRFPFFIQGEIGVDTFLHNTLSNRFIENGKIEYLLSILSIFEYYPDSLITGPIIYTSTISILSGLPSYEVVFLVSTFAGCLSTINFFVLLNSKFFKRILSNTSKLIIITAYCFMPLLFKFTDWSLTGRTIFFMIVPLVLILMFNSIFEKGYNLKIKLIYWILIFFSLVLSHGMGRILFLFGVILVIIKLIFQKFNVERFNKKLLDFIILLSGIFLFLLPYLLVYFGDLTLVGWWVFDRSSLTEAFGIIRSREPIDFFLGFLFMFGARLGFVALFFIIGLLLFPIISPPSKELRLLIIATIAIFPFFPQSMYFYQALAPIIVIIAGINMYYLFKLLGNKFSYIINIFKKREIKKSKKLKSILLISFIFSNAILVEYIQYYRSLGEGNPITVNTINLTRYLDQKSKNLTVVCSNAYLSNQISAYSTHVISFPMHIQTFLASYPQYEVRIKTEIRNDGTILSGLINFFRYGPFESNSYVILGNINNILFANNANNTFANFIELNEIFKFDYFIYKEGDNWPLLDLLVSNGSATLINELGVLKLYLISLS